MKQNKQKNECDRPQVIKKELKLKRGVGKPSRSKAESLFSSEWHQNLNAKFANAAAYGVGKAFIRCTQKSTHTCPQAISWAFKSFVSETSELW
jgi:hypothetical protein